MNETPDPMDSPEVAGVTDLRSVGDRIERLLDELRATAPARVYERVEDVLRLITDLYGAGLRHVVEAVGDADKALLGALLDDELVASLLVVHGLHPDTLMARVERSLDGVRPVLAQHGGDVELLELDEAAGAVRLRMLGNCDGCPSSTVTLHLAVEKAIFEAAPEVVIVDVERPPDFEPGEGLAPVVFVAKPLYESCPSEVVDR
jgi:Fe-S cluster biogenesis protein NfuA